MTVKLLTLRVTAERINVPEATLRYWRYMGAGPRGTRIGRRVMFVEEEVDAWVKAQIEAARRSA